MDILAEAHVLGKLAQAGIPIATAVRVIMSQEYDLTRRGVVIGIYIAVNFNILGIVPQN